MSTGTNTAKAIVGLAADAASIAIPGAVAQIQLGRAAAAGLIEMYDALMASRPADVTVEEWRSILRSPIHQSGFVDSAVNEARAKLKN